MATLIGSQAASNGRFTWDNARRSCGLRVLEFGDCLMALESIAGGLPFRKAEASSLSRALSAPAWYEEW